MQKKVKIKAQLKSHRLRKREQIVTKKPNTVISFLKRKNSCKIELRSKCYMYLRCIVFM